MWYVFLSFFALLYFCTLLFNLLISFLFFKDSDPEDVPARPRPRAPRGSDELSESDMNFFTQQFQAPYSRKDQEIGPKQSPDGCKGINCYRCSAFIPECQGVCSKCGTLCQRPGGPCKACRDICESCGKPRYRCTSAGERLEASGDEKDGDEEDVDTDGIINNWKQWLFVTSYITRIVKCTASRVNSPARLITTNCCLR